MLNESDVKKIAQVFDDKGIGIVLIYGHCDYESTMIKCFSTIRSGNELENIIVSMASNLSLFPVIRDEIIEELIVDSPDEGLGESAKWAASVLNNEPNLVIAAVGEEVFSAYAVGEVSYMVYMAMRILTMTRQNKTDIDILDSPPNMN
jgi:hypothetical protein